MARAKSFPGLFLNGKIGKLVFVQRGEDVNVRSLPERRKPKVGVKNQLKPRTSIQRRIAG
ncbi:hypothetical protein [Gaoshiqia sp. Z1-71]|uniref:hypothetical protein n=1 Tax=Gaoshiqia hydrogeniformans TaxID=3290090 RepID=UPI003BF91ACD